MKIRRAAGVNPPRKRTSSVVQLVSGVPHFGFRNRSAPMTATLASEGSHRPLAGCTGFGFCRYSGKQLLNLLNERQTRWNEPFSVAYTRRKSAGTFGTTAESRQWRSKPGESCWDLWVLRA